jgi:hypothetical protein
LIDAFLSKTSVTGPRPVTVDSLSRAIEDLREELISWIDTELARLQAPEQGEDHAAEGISGAPQSTRYDLRVGRASIPLTSSDGANPGTADCAPRMEGDASRNRQRSAGRDSKADVTVPPIAVGGFQTEPEVQTAPLNPSQRLDALARLLDRRLKQVDGVKSDDSAPIGDSERH